MQLALTSNVPLRIMESHAARPDKCLLFLSSIDGAGTRSQEFLLKAAGVFLANEARFSFSQAHAVGILFRARCPPS